MYGRKTKNIFSNHKFVKWRNPSPPPHNRQWWVSQRKGWKHLERDDICNVSPKTLYYTTRKHSSRMHTARLSMVRASNTRNEYQLREGGLKWTNLNRSPVMTTGGGAGLEPGASYVWCLGDGTLYTDVQCIMGNGYMWIPPVSRQTDMSENITSRNFVDGR